MSVTESDMDLNSNSKVAPYAGEENNGENIKKCDATIQTTTKPNEQQLGMTPEEDNKIIGYCGLVAKHPNLTFGITLGAHVILLVLTAILFASGYDILPVDFKGVPLTLEDDPTKLRTDAWWYAKDDDRVTILTGGQQLRGVAYQSIEMVYERKDGNVFTRENLLDIKKNEEDLINNDNYQNKLCQLQGTENRTCKLPLSILRFFDGSYKAIHPTFDDPDFQNIPTVLNTAMSINISKVILNYHLGKDAVVSKTKATSPYTRTMVYMGFPIEGYNSTEDREEDQSEEINRVISDTFSSTLEEKYKSGVGGMNFYYDNMALNVDALQKQVIFDMMLAVASFVFIFFFMWLQTGSLWLAAWGIFSIISSFNITNLIYRVVFDYRYFGVFHVLSIFIILGIGSDNVFVFMDTWKQSAKLDHESLAVRLSYVYKRAAKATFITSFTTTIAFLSNVPSPLLAISSFGLFSAVLIVINYLSVILFYPTAIIMHHVRRRGRCCCGPMCCRSTSEDQPNHGEDQAKKTVSERIIGFFEGWFFRNVITHRITRWVVVLIFTIILVTAIIFATKLGPDEEQVAVWGENTNWGKIKELRKSAFRASQEDNVIVVHIIWGLREQDRGSCHHTDYQCKGKTVLDKSFDLNPPPCQNAVLKLCEKIKGLPADQQNKLKLRRSPVTGEIEVTCIFERMNEYLTVEGNKSKYHGADFSFPLNSQKMTTLMKANSAFYNVSLLPDTYYRYFEVGIGYFITNGYGNDPNYATTYDFEKYGKMMAGTPDPTSGDNDTISVFQGNKYGHRIVYIAIAVNTTLKPATLGYASGLPVYRDWEEFVTDEMDDMPSSCNGGFQATVSPANEWHWLKVQEILVKNAFQGIAIGLCLSMVVLIVATTNWVVGILATLIIAMITCAVLGIITIIGWKLGVLESLNLTLVVGLAVDYVVHLAEGYMELKNEDRREKVRYTLGHVGISVFSGACTTLGASVFMLAAKIVFFFQFGIFIFCTIGFSILFSLIFFTTLLALVGPDGSRGSLMPLVDTAKNYVRGKTKHHADCMYCKGKGFVRLTNSQEVDEVGIDNTAAV